jgi:SPP1 gp7 family putative phage head morphogenesis protein
VEEIKTYTETFRKHYDPTHTTALRNAYAKDMKRRFIELAYAIKIGVGKNDCFGLKEQPIHSLQMTIPIQGSFAFPRSQDKLVKFMEWLQKQVDAGILTVKQLEQVGTSVEAMWQNLYLFDSYKRGVMRARYEMIRAGMDIPSIEDTGGIFMVLGLPFHIERLGLLYTRVFTDLKGITDTMDSIISRILAQGLADGDAPALLARKLVAAINGEGLGDLGLTDTLGRTISPLRRAELLARTEIIRAHHLATIQEYRNWGVEGITVMGEWRTAGDDRVCEKCALLEGKIFTLDEIESLIPLHPLCRCIALPYIEGLNKYKK